MLKLSLAKKSHFFIVSLLSNADNVDKSTAMIVAVTRNYNVTILRHKVTIM